MQISDYTGNPLGNLQKGYDAAQGLQNDFALRQAGNDLAASGAYTPAVNDLLKAGMVDQGQALQQNYQAVQDAQRKQQQQAVADHLSFLSKAADALSNIPDTDGKQTARRQALAQYIAPGLQQMGYSAQDVANLQNGDLSDQALSMFRSNVDLQLEKIGNSVVGIDKRTGKVKSAFTLPPEKEVKVIKNGDGSESVVLVDPNDTGASGAAPAAGGAAPAAAPQAAGAAPAIQGASRGARNNNPLNVSTLPNGQSWQGQTGADGQYAVFGTSAAGWAAADKNLASYGARDGVTTLAGVIQRWAPAAAGNDTASYIKTVASDLGVDPNAKLDLSNPQVRQAVLQSMAKVELGTGGTGQPEPAAPPAQPAPAQSQVGATGTRVLYTSKPKPDDGSDDAAMTPDTIDLLAGVYLKDRTLPPMGMGKQAAANKTAILNRATVLAKGLGIDANDLVAGTLGVKAAGQALAKATATRSAVEGSEATVLKNANLALSLAPAGGSTTNVPVLNRWIQAGRKNVAGDPQVAAFDQALGTVADEYAKVMTTSTGSGGGATSDSARQEAYRRFNSAMTQDQLKSVLGVMEQEMANRSSSLRAVEQGLQNQIRGGASAPSPGPAPAPASPASGWGKATVVAH